MTIITSFVHAKDYNNEDYLFSSDGWDPKRPSKPFRVLSAVERKSFYDENLENYRARKEKERG